MKGKFPTIVMAMMALVLALSLAVVGAGVQTDEAEAADLSWSTLVTPAPLISIYAMSDIIDLELSPNYATDMTAYASINDPMKLILGTTIGTLGVAKSNNGGVMWSACTEPQNPVGTAPGGPLIISVAPDNPNYVVATDGYTVWASADGGGTWANYGNAAGIDPAATAPLITSIDVGPAMAGTNPVAIGVNDNVWDTGLRLWVTAALTGAAPVTVTVTYTNSAGGVRTGTAVLPTGAEAIGWNTPVILQGVDTGMTAVIGATCSVADPTGVVQIQGTPSAAVGGTLTLTPVFPAAFVAGAALPVAAAVDPNGVYVWGWGSPPSLSWSPQGLIEDVWAVALSPNYTSDFTIVAVGTTAVPVNNVHLGDGNLSIAAPGNWDAAAIFGAGWPQTSLAPGTFDTGVLALTGAVIALPADFNGLLGGMQVAFVGTTGGTTPDIYRVRNVGSLGLGSGLAAGVASLDMVGNIGGSAAIMAGAVAPSATLPYANVTYTADPWSAAPWWSGANKAPTGLGGAAQVVLHPDYLTNGEALCGTGPFPGPADESALSKTVNSGVTWNQISLIDTDITRGIADLAPSPDYGTDQTLFVATCSVTTPFDSLWKSTMGGILWERIDVFPWTGAASTLNDTAIVRVSPNYGTDTTIYWAETGAGANRIRVSVDDGGFFLTKTVGWAGGGIADIAVEDGTTLYVGSGGSVGKSTDGASSWPTMGSTIMPVGLLALDVGTGDLFVSGSGLISYCDTSTMTIGIQGQLTGAAAGSIQWLALSNNYASDKTVYVADNTGPGMIWKLAGAGGALPPTMTQISLVPAPVATGLAVSDEGVLYCADAAAWAAPPAVPVPPFPAGAGGVLRSVNPDAEPVTFGTSPEFLRMTQGFAALPVAPTILPGGAGVGNTSVWMAEDGTLFVRDTANPILVGLFVDRILVYTDTLPMTPTQSSPADGATGVGTQVGQLTGVVMYYATVEWGAVSGAYGYGLQIDSDPSFANPIVNIGIQVVAWGGAAAATNPLAFWNATPINQPATSYTTPAGAATLLNPDTEYFWRVRVDNTALGTGSAVGQWSSDRSFITGTGIGPPRPALQSPDPGDTGVPLRPTFTWTAVAGMTNYDFQLATDAEFTDLLVDVSLGDQQSYLPAEDLLEEETQYFWRVRASNGSTTAWSTGGFTTELPTDATPIWVWIVIAIGAVVAIVVIVLIVRTRRPV